MYKHLVRVLATIQGLLLVSMAHAQSAILDLPRASQHAVVTQRIGIADVTINYHRPVVNKRKVWGGLVPYGDVWRAGANENTNCIQRSGQRRGKDFAQGNLRSPYDSW